MLQVFSNKTQNASICRNTMNELVLAIESKNRILVSCFNENGLVLNEKELQLRQSPKQLKRLEIFESFLFILFSNELQIYRLLDLSLFKSIPNVSKYQIIASKGREVQLLYALEKDYLLYKYDSSLDSILFYTFTGDFVTCIQTLNSSNSKECFLLASMDEEIRFYKKEMCLGEVSLCQKAYFLQEWKKSPWSFGFATKNWIGMYTKTRLVWKYYSSASIYFFKNVGVDSEYLIIGFEDLKIEIREFSNGNVISTLHFDSFVLDCMIHSDLKLYFVLESGSMLFFT